MIDLAQIRLECLKLAHRLDHSPEMVIDRAREYELYLMPIEASEKVHTPDNRKRPGDGGKKPTA
jgi:hypothetical protein